MSEPILKPLRRDVAMRRDALLDAADAVFSEHGVNVALDLVVERAGVGRATLYRNFSDRGALLAALLERSLLALEEVARQNADRDDALYRLLDQTARNVARSAPLVDYWRALDRTDPVVRAARRRMAALYGAPLRRALVAGLCRADLRLQDIFLISGMLGAALRGASSAERDTMARRALHLLLAGLHPPAAEK